MSRRKLDGKVAWISGGGSGIGEGTAMVFAEGGARVAVIDLKRDAAERVAEQIRRVGNEAVAIACDVAREDDVRRSIEQTVSQFGSLQILVNNAGIVQIGPLHESTEADWDRLMAVNVKSIFLSLKHAFPHLKRAGRSWIVNVASISSFVGQAGTPAYTTSKHAVLGLTRSIALDYARDGVRCNCVCPGITDTPLLRHHLNATGDAEGTLAARLRRVAMGVSLTPRDIGRSILYLACDDSFGVTGTSITIDCGYLAAAEWDTRGERTAFMEKRPS